MGSDRAYQPMAIRSADEQVTTRTQNSRQFDEALDRAVYVFNHMVIEDRIKPSIFEWKLADTGDLKVGSWLRMINGVDEVLDIDRIHIRVKPILNCNRFMPRTAASDKDFW
jgi:hypothetical protein